MSNYLPDFFVMVVAEHCKSAATSLLRPAAHKLRDMRPTLLLLSVPFLFFVITRHFYLFDSMTQ